MKWKWFISHICNHSLYVVTCCSDQFDPKVKLEIKGCQKCQSILSLQLWDIFHPNHEHIQVQIVWIMGTICFLHPHSVDTQQGGSKHIKKILCIDVLATLHSVRQTFTKWAAKPKGWESRRLWKSRLIITVKVKRMSEDKDYHKLNSDSNDWFWTRWGNCHSYSYKQHIHVNNLMKNIFFSIRQNCLHKT